MNTKIYEKTRYQNIYRHKKNKNYIIMISSPVKTSISSIDGNKIMRLEDAIKIRDNPKIKIKAENNIINKEDFNMMWDKYILYCTNIKKLAFNTLDKKNKIYNKYLKNEFSKKLSKINKDDIVNYFNSLKTTEKQKKEIFKLLKAFFNWCLEEEYLLISPIKKNIQFKTEKSEMKYWTPKEIKQILSTLDYDIENNIDIFSVRRVKLLILIGFSLGDRIGETRALTYDCFDDKLDIVKIKHSINYDRYDTDYLSNTKNYHSQRNINISKRIIDEVKDYREFLINNTNYDIKETDIIFYNYKLKKPYSDTSLRKEFYKYCNKAGVTKIRMYDLRHTYVATMMAEGKELYYISERLGHNNYNTTVNKYGHLSNEKRKEIAESTDKYI